MTRAVVLSTGTVGLGVIRALGTMGVPITGVYYERRDAGFRSKYVDKRIAAPHPEREEQEFIRLLLEEADTSSRPVLIPADDETLSTVSKHKKALESRYIVACADADVAETFLTKKYTYELAAAAGVRTPKTIVPASIADVERHAAEFEFPCLVKPTQSHRYFELFGQKMAKVNDLSELCAEYTRSTTAGVEMMIQELIPGGDGEGANYNCYFWDGRPLVEFTAAKVRLGPPGFGFPRVVVSKDVPEIRELGHRVLASMGVSGFACVEFKRDVRNGAYTLMEVNGRHNRSALLAFRCGINFPWIEYEHLVHGRFDAPPAAREGIYWIDEFKDVVESVRWAKEERFRLSEYARPYLAPHILATFNIKDPKPFLKRCGDALKMAGKLIVRRRSK